MTNTDSNRCRGRWRGEVCAQVERAPQVWDQGGLHAKWHLGLEGDRGLVCRDAAAGVPVRGAKCSNPE